MNAHTFVMRIHTVDAEIQSIDRDILRLSARREKLMRQWAAAWHTRVSRSAVGVVGGTESGEGDTP